ncbi:methyl-accepting chemotaxis protein [Heyndrickxia acidiproducens]|uniref:methyl-accepting chemotaxis protein n=1 Tax=Heyndrickxia acidiproducens TaxID=1121084 RepID=UPI0003806046|nr:methyl-accepting chemotaxis protein [Heyndrickxia acidiproducens]
MKRKEQQKTAKRFFSLRYKWGLIICATILISIITTVGLMYFTTGKILKTNDRSVNKMYANQVAARIEAELSNYENSLSQLDGLVTADIQQKKKMSDIEASIHAVQSRNSTLVAAYYMDFQTGKLHISPYAKMDLDVRNTNIYKYLTANPKTQWMDVYQDKVTGKIMTSVVSPVFSEGKMIGAVGYDINLSTIGKARAAIEKESDHRIAILDPKGVIVTSFIKNGNGRNIRPSNSGKVEGVKDISSAARLKKEFNWADAIYSRQNSTGTFTWNGTSYNLYATTVPKMGWKVISFEPQQAFAAKVSKLKHAGLLSILIGLVIGILFAAFIAGYLVKIIKKLQQVLGKTAEGDLVTKFVVHSNDEIGDLSKSYNNMLHGMRNLIAKVHGNVDSVNEAASGLKRITGENQAAITDVSKAVEEIAAGASNQSDQAEAGSVAVHDLSGEIEKLAEQSGVIEKAVDEANTQIESGTKQVEGLEGSYQKLEQAFEKVTAMITNLNEKSQSISEVTGVISQIAEQTNLLSLNASIEAARAGENGKGFAIVANEVRNLAEQSKKSTKAIQKTIADVLVDTKELVGVMTETNQIRAGQKTAVTSVSSSMADLTNSLRAMVGSLKQEAASIGTIRKQKETVVQMIEEISAVSQQTAAASEEIASSTEEQAASANEIARHTEKLFELTEELEKEIGTFTFKAEN